MNLKFFKKVNFNFLFSLISIIVFFITLLSYDILPNGDSSIYFTYMKDFKIEPFHFGYKIKQGATSPLWVLINSIFFSQQKFDEWLLFMKWMVIILLMSSFIVILFSSKIYKSVDMTTIFTIFYTYSLGLYLYSFSLYELPLTIFLISIAYYFLKKDYLRCLIFILSLLPLLRPELIIFSSIIVILEFKKDFKKILMSLILIFSPLIIIQLYFFIYTNEFIPSSVFGRILTNIENKDYSWFDKLIISISSIKFDIAILVLSFSLIFSPLIIKKFSDWDIRDKKLYLFTILFLIPFIFFPPLNYTSRYLSPILPLSSVLFSKVIFSLLNPLKKYYKNIITTLLVISMFLSIPIHLYSSSKLNKKYDFDTVLGKDFAELSKSIGISKSDFIGIYEIQFQFHSDARLISLDGIVGGEVFNYLLKKENFETFIRKNKISYIVTMSSFKYRKIFKQTELERIYNHDLMNPIGSVITIGKLKIKKIAVNPIFDKPGAVIYKDGLTLYSSFNEKWAGHYVLWNSIYKIIEIEKVD